MFSVLLATAMIVGGLAPAYAETPGTAPETIQGVVSTQEGSVRLPGAVVSLLDPAGAQIGQQLSGADGTFRFDAVAVGRYRVVAALDGFKTTEATVEVSAGRIAPVTLDLPIAEIAERVDVVAPAAAASDAIASAESVTSGESDDFSPGGGVHGALRLLANVIQLPGGISIKGGRPNQSGAQLEAGTLVDPSSGVADLNLPADAIDSVSVMANPYAVEFGRFSSGLIVIQTKHGGDQWRVRLNDLDPNLRTSRHNDLKVIGLGEFSPRLEVGGPLIKDRLFLEQTAQYHYTANDVPSRPETELRTDQWFSSFTRLDANLSNRQSLVMTAGLFPSRATDATLGTFTPPAATVNLSERIDHAAATERAVWSNQVVSESTVRIQRDHETVGPQGSAPMLLLPDTTLGNFFNRQDRTTSIIQWTGSVGATVKGPGGIHLFKVGLDLLHATYDGTSTSSPVTIARPDGSPARTIQFGAATRQRVESNDIALFAQDRLQTTTRWYLEFGGRLDHDGVLDRLNLTPRIGTAVQLDASGNAVLRGGFGLFYERTPSAAGAFDQFPTAIETRFAADGTVLVPPTAFPHVVAANLSTARSATWNIAFEHRLGPSWSYHAGLLARTGSHELVVEPLRTDTGGQLTLSDSGRSVYRDAEFGVHFTRRSAVDVNATYIRSLARGNLNGFSNFFGNVEWPVIGADSYAATATDIPNRILARARVMTARWLFVGLADWHSGVPYSVVNEALDFVGARNAYRLPDALHLELGAERRFRILRWQPWIGVRVTNPFNAFLPTDVQANLASPAFGSFYNSEIRKLRLIIRFGR